MIKRGLLSLFSGFFAKKKFFGNYYSALSSVKVRDIMIKDVLTIRRDDKLLEAAHTMIGAHASCLVVVERDKPIGIITERDFVKKLGMAKDHHEEMIVNDIMTKQLFTISPNANLFGAQQIMMEHKFRKLVIVDNNELRGIITQTDLCRVVAELGVSYPNPPLVKQVMTKKVLAIGEDDQFLKAKKLMISKDVGSVLIVEKGKIMGIFTEFDLVSEFFMNANRLRNSFMKDLMTTPVVCISPDLDLFHVNKLMLEHNFRRLPVVENNNVLGIITQTDVARGLYQFIENHNDFVCEPAKANKTESEPVYFMRKFNNLIVCERSVPKSIKSSEKK
jgi:CBS domain-containing protein